jgi:formylglycine-generating enzyme required for sulfatase activity
MLRPHASTGSLLLLLLATLAACDENPATKPIPPRSELSAAAKERLAAYLEPNTWEDLDASHPGHRVRDPRTGIVFVRVPAGDFTMGNNTTERPEHRVRLTQDYLLAETELTIGQWKQFVREFAGDPAVPVPDQTDEHPMPVSCLDALAFCERYGYRLPTEAEWERACTGGVAREQEPWNNEEGMRAHAWFHRNADMHSHPVRTREPNAFGLYDMLGNLWEFCGENFNPAAYQNRGELATDPHGPSTPVDHVLRGGSWFSVPPATPRTRLAAGFAERTAFFGCRVARSAPPK